MLQSACELAPCLEGIRGLASYTTSSSDTWILELKPGTKYENKEIRTAFLKFWLDKSSLPWIKTTYGERKGDFRFGFNPEDLRKDLSGLNYELLVYKKIVRPLVDFSVCPHFVRFLGKGVRCTGKDLIKVLYQGLTGEGSDEEGEARARFARNFEFLYSGEANRPSITSSSGASPPRIIQQLAADSKYNLLVTESMTKKDDVKLDDFMDMKFRGPSVWRVLFQILAACYALSLAKTVHNDLHPQNVYVRLLKQPQPALYVYNDKWYQLNTEHFVRLYDFDRAYTKSIGNNKYLRGYTDFNQTNEFVPNKDAVKICSYIYSMLGRSRAQEREQLLQAISPSPEFAQKFLTQSPLTAVVYLQHPKTSKNLSASDLDTHFYPVETMLHNVGKLAGVVMSGEEQRKAAGLLASQKKIAYYACNRRMFDRNTGAFAKGEKVRGLYNAMLSNAVERCEARIRRCQQEIRVQKEKIASLQRTVDQAWWFSNPSSTSSVVRKKA